MVFDEELDGVSFELELLVCFGDWNSSHGESESLSVYVDILVLCMRNQMLVS